MIGFLICAVIVFVSLSILAGWVQKEEDKRRRAKIYDWLGVVKPK